MPDRRRTERVEDQLCFALYAASRAMTARYRPALEELSLTYPQYLVMMVLWDEGPVSVRQLGARLRLDSGTLSPLLTRLERARLIRRDRNPDDERSVTIQPTAEGHRLRERAADIPREINAELAGFDHPRLTAELRDLEAALRSE